MLGWPREWFQGEVQRFERDFRLQSSFEDSRHRHTSSPSRLPQRSPQFERNFRQQDQDCAGRRFRNF